MWRACLLVLLSVSAIAAAPNVLLVLTDDQGYGDLGCHGNPHIRTPNLDQMAKDGTVLTHFYVSPVCSPTRSSLLTGRWTYRTGVVDTFIGRSMMHTDEVTLAEHLRAAGYRTGIFGKWHLGDHYPLRAQDQGFDETRTLNGGGLGQPSDLAGGTSYFDPLLLHNGSEKKHTGYISDVLTTAALDWLRTPSKQPFFAYVAYNCPHTPLEVPDTYLQAYAKKDLGPMAFPKLGQPFPASKGDTTARVYAMVQNIDDNVGKLLAAVPRDTLVIFLTDNGPQQPRYNAGMRGRKGTVYEGGIRVPCLVRHPGVVPAGGQVPLPAAHIDLLPTILAATGTALPAAPRIDGISLWDALRGQGAPAPAERTLAWQWHRGSVPEAGRACAVRVGPLKLVQANGVEENKPFTPKWELLDRTNDPFEQTDLAAQRPDDVTKLRRAYDGWFADVQATRQFALPRIIVGHTAQPSTRLTRQDWRGPQAGWTPQSVGHWEIAIAQAGTYRVEFTCAAQPTAGTARLQVGKLEHTLELAANAKTGQFAAVDLPIGPTTVQITLTRGQSVSGPTTVTLGR
jgi:arylsulfatase A-like enzyme